MSGTVKEAVSLMEVLPESDQNFVLEFIKKLRFFSLAVILWIIMSITMTACSPMQGRVEPYSASFFAMDTYMTFTVYDDDAKAAKAALQQAQEEIGALEELWSVTDEDSDIYALNHSGGQPVTVRDETAGLLSFAVKMAQETDGALEPTLYPVLTAWGFTTEVNRIPAAEEIERLLECVGYDRVKVEGSLVTLEDGMMLDLGSVGKGYAGDRAERILIERGINSALLDIGGNIQAVGARPDGSDWRLGLRSPFGEGIFGTLQISDRAVVTSGNYERYFIGEDGVRYGHIIDPETGYPVNNGLASVTIIAGDGKLCDALSTSLFVMGLSDAVAYWKTHQEEQPFDMILVTEDRKIYLTEEIKDKFNLQKECADMVIYPVTSSAAEGQNR